MDDSKPLPTPIRTTTTRDADEDGEPVRCLLVACLPKSDLSFPSDHRSAGDNWNSN
jgi:hypothetical protein